jgi:hypothetical protein
VRTVYVYTISFYDRVTLTRRRLTEARAWNPRVARRRASRSR